MDKDAGFDFLPAQQSIKYILKFKSKSVPLLKVQDRTEYKPRKDPITAITNAI